ncbi:ABC-type multidrug transport system permease subunit [Enterococcus sp. PF1-24]|uniref:DUF2975 domain-containing protein n=1 Tax=unclassified Enterococcus TaxID=2608891 RepID=UPI002475906E|nr:MULTISPECIES: DUF2975 domain-containing protein [unclassified Enterococcus]MDH6364865.1 ABC-type multidrug transport system permease subunit [Enterococcus sp. PFB1-1]MDH6401911.1 ABC-type multidrug transport system permease subunit [Enterococcus sp. PF1-24]
MMKTEKNLYKGLKWVFGFMTAVMGTVSVAALLVWLLTKLPVFTKAIASADISELPFGANTLKIISSPVLVLSLVANFALYGAVCYFARKFFKNLENEEIFVAENVKTAKKIAALMLVLAVASTLPDTVAHASQLIGDSSFLDVTYVVVAAIVWALSKILEKANQIAEENEMTI